MSISRTQLKNDLGLVKVADITSVRKALGQPEWKNSQISEFDAHEIREYYRLIRDGISTSEALLQIAVERNGRSEFCDEIDPEALEASDASRDCEEEKDGILQVAQAVAQEGAAGMFELSDAVSDVMIDGFKLGLTAHMAAKMSDLAGNIRDNFKPLTEAIRATNLDLRSVNLPTVKEVPKLQQSKKQRQILPGLW
ncbi:MAG: hypothetical protein P2A85_29305 (plasmid) [Microcoleus anatoxicus]|uniref:hypothetical protein n=1 Tax=Microcoleus anatoxicus TaxID=2705319 RepID=UPI003672DB31